MIENSNMIQIYTPFTRTIWLGDEWSHLSFGTKVDDFFRQEVQFVLQASIRIESKTNDGMDEEILYYSSTEALKFQFEKHSSCNPTVISAHENIHNKVFISVHNSFLREGDTLQLIIVAKNLPGDATNDAISMYGCSVKIL